jgi:hypothetical protein
MKIQIQQIRDIIDSIFSNSGYNIKNLNLQFPHPLDMKITRNNEDITLTFTQSMPKVTWKKFISLSARIIGITLGETGGVLKLKYLPDITFSYDDSSTEQLFGKSYNFYDIEEDIYSEYEDEESRIVAKKCLHYASEWATIASQGCDFASATPITRRKLKKDCKQFVMDNIKNDPEIQAGSVILTFLFFYVVLPVILKFILERLFKKLFN